MKERRLEGCECIEIRSVLSKDGTGSWNVGNPVTVSVRVALGRDEWCLSLRVRLPDVGPMNEIPRVGLPSPICVELKMGRDPPLLMKMNVRSEDNWLSTRNCDKSESEVSRKSGESR